MHELRRGQVLDDCRRHFICFVLELRPTAPQPTYERIVFYVDRATYQVARTVVIDAQGNRNQFTFTRPQVNLNVPESTFNWSPPAGTSIVRP